MSSDPAVMTTVLCIGGNTSRGETQEMFVRGLTRSLSARDFAKLNVHSSAHGLAFDSEPRRGGWRQERGLRFLEEGPSERCPCCPNDWRYDLYVETSRRAPTWTGSGAEAS